MRRVISHVLADETRYNNRFDGLLFLALCAQDAASSS